jgi:23S rRNA (guanosine2251-2'-O)-methyltransferase
VNDVILVAHNIRSAHNVGSLLRTADGLGVNKVYLTGYTPYPATEDDERLPHVAKRADKSIRKTSLGAEKHVAWKYAKDPQSHLMALSEDGYQLCALEQTPTAIDLGSYRPSPKTVLVIGSEIGGVSKLLLDFCPTHLMIPMRGHKDSYNVAIAAAIAMHHLIG